MTWASKQIQTALNVILDELWAITDPHQYIELQDVMEIIRQLFNMLCERLDANEEKINDLEKTLNNASISEGHLLLGSVATQILAKMGRVLNRDDPLYIPRSIRRGRKLPFLILFDSFGSDRITVVFHRIVNERNRSDNPFSGRLRQLLTVYDTTKNGRNTICDSDVTAIRYIEDVRLLSSSYLFFLVSFFRFSL